jgi:hypothetical protein
MGPSWPRKGAGKGPRGTNGSEGPGRGEQGHEAGPQGTDPGTKAPEAGPNRGHREADSDPLSPAEPSARSPKVVEDLSWLVEKQRPDRWDLLGAAVSLLGIAIIAFGPKL